MVLLSAGGQTVSQESVVQPLVRRGIVSGDSLGFSNWLDSNGETGGNMDPVLGTSAALTRSTVTESEGSPLLFTAPSVSTTSRLSALSLPFVPSTAGHSALTSIVPSVPRSGCVSTSVSASHHTM